MHVLLYYTEPIPVKLAARVYMCKYFVLNYTQDGQERAMKGIIIWDAHAPMLYFRNVYNGDC